MNTLVLWILLCVFNVAVHAAAPKSDTKSEKESQEKTAFFSGSALESWHKWEDTVQSDCEKSGIGTLRALSIYMRQQGVSEAINTESCEREIDEIKFRGKSYISIAQKVLNKKMDKANCCDWFAYYRGTFLGCCFMPLLEWWEEFGKQS